MPISTVCLVLSGLLWGTGGLIGTLFGQDAGLSPLSVATWRLLAGGLLLIALRAVPRGAPSRAGRRFPSGRRAWTRIAVNGVLSAIFQATYFAAIAVSSVSLATLVTIGAAPVIVAVAEQARGQRSLGRPGLLTLALALTGLALLTGLPSGGLSEGAVLASSGLALASAAGFAAITVLGTSPVPGLDELALNGYGFLLGGVVLLPVALAFGAPGAGSPGLAGVHLGLAALGLLAALIIGPTAVAYTLYFRGLRTAPASTAALLTLVEPLAAAILAALVLGDRLGAVGIAGAAMLLAAVARTALAGARRPALDPEG
ncbi:MAG TPA: EamA family transporter [Trebonia sp.]|jgi:DME family drug/metabolite transporter|nr:EamA family transporter [Trebonia sp.]